LGRLLVCLLTGIAAAGGIFGFCIGLLDNPTQAEIGEAIAGLIAGPVIAVIFAVPIVLAVAIFAWAFWLLRYAVVWSSVCGAITGIMSYTWTGLDRAMQFPANWAVILAGIIGAVVPLFFASFYRKKRHAFYLSASGPANAKWHYSLRDLFVRFTVVTVLIAVICFIAFSQRGR